MARGGSRNGAGRPKGSKTLKSRAEGNRLARKDLTPLKVMEKAMLEHWDKQEWDAAASVAKDMAPYVHAKLAAIQVSGPAGESIFGLSNDRIRQALAEPDGNGIPPPVPG